MPVLLAREIQFAVLLFVQVVLEGRPGEVCEAARLGVGEGAGRRNQFLEIVLYAEHP